MHFLVLALFHKMNSNPGAATVLHVLLVIALLLTFGSYWGKRKLADAVAFLLGYQLQHTLIYTVAGWKTCSGYLPKREVKVKVGVYGSQRIILLFCVFFFPTSFFFYKLNNSFEQSEPKRSICREEQIKLSINLATFRW